MRIALAAALAIVGPAAAQEKTMHHATGTFEVKIAPEAQGAAPADGLPTARMGLAKTFSGGVVGSATGTMLSAGSPAPGKVAAYVALDQFSGSVDGRKGGFLLIHRGTMDGAGGGEFVVAIAPGSGTGALAGIAGTLDIKVEGGAHHYDLAYTLPAAAR